MRTALRKPKPRIHNEYFMLLAKHKCPTCHAGSASWHKARLLAGLAPREVVVYAWGEYVNGKWRTVKHFCQQCFETEVNIPLLHHAMTCGCGIQFLPRSGTSSLPDWLKLHHIECQVSSGNSPDISTEKQNQ